MFLKKQKTKRKRKKHNLPLGQAKARPRPTRPSHCAPLIFLIPLSMARGATPRPSSLHPLGRVWRACVLRRCRLAPVFRRLRPIPPRLPRSAPRLPGRLLTSRDQKSPTLPSPSPPLLPLGGNVINGIAAAPLPLPGSPPLYPCYKARASTSISWFVATSHLSPCLLLAVKIIVDRSVVPIVRRRWSAVRWRPGPRTPPYGPPLLGRPPASPSPTCRPPYARKHNKG